MVNLKKSVQAKEQFQVKEWDGKHPLAWSWSLWYFNYAIAKNWEDCVKKLGSFNTIEDFWSYFNHLQPPSSMKLGCDFSIFKEGIRPMWEDEANKRGGRWDIHLEKVSFSNANFDEYWISLAMDLIGGRFAAYDNILNGAIASRRDKANRISLWTSCSDDRERLITLIKTVREAIGLPSDHKICFRAHQDSYACQTVFTYRV